MNSFDEFAIGCATGFAICAHGDQKYGDNQPYSDHLTDVFNVLQEYGVTDTAVLVAAILHDVVEDTPITVDVVARHFGDEVADLVYRVTNKPGVNRAARHAATYPGIRENELAVLIKLADRIANVRSGAKNGMYAKEHDSFKRVLFKGDDHPQILKMWFELDSLLSA